MRPAILKIGICHQGWCGVNALVKIERSGLITTIGMLAGKELHLAGILIKPGLTNDVVWAAAYEQAPQVLKNPMNLTYLTGQRPAGVIVMNQCDVEGDYLTVQQRRLEEGSEY